MFVRCVPGLELSSGCRHERHRLPLCQGRSGTGLDEIQCSLPMENRRVFLHELSEASFSECKFSLSLTDLFIIIFSGVAVSIAAIISSFFLATVVQCFQRCAPNKDTEDEDEDEDD
ncbi:hypothetical protein CB1_002337040 [Camelus ferus]|nr:hypothetical protein CB1_002337040 [Camelus ferus]